MNNGFVGREGEYETPEEAMRKLSEKIEGWKRDELEVVRQWPPANTHVFEDFIHAGLRCLVLDGPTAINGYVHVPVGHPCERLGYDEVDVDVHGGLTFRCRASDGSWFGFDTAHYGDNCKFHSSPEGRNWTPESVARETECLAEQLSALAEPVARGSETGNPEPDSSLTNPHQKEGEA